MIGVAILSPWEALTAVSPHESSPRVRRQMRTTILGAVIASALTLAACTAGEVADSANGVAATPRATPTPSEPQSSPPATPSVPPDPIYGNGRAAGWDTASAVVRGNDGYLALGWHYEPNPHIGYNGGPRLWGSSDGVVWEPLPAPTELGFVLGNVVSLVATPSGEFLLFANADDAENVLRPVVMRSTDGLSWEVERVDLPRRLYLTRVVNGPKGYLLAGRDDGPGGLWLSADGLAWRPVHALTQTDTTYESITDIGAGEDGFVAVGISGVVDGESNYFALASGDGTTWFRSEEPLPADDGHAAIAFVAPIGGDWVATSGWSGTTSQFWRSADGLHWERAGAIEQVPPTNPVLASAGGQLFYSNTGTEVPVGQPGGWTSADGETWTPVDLGPDGVLAGAYEDDEGLLLLGTLVISGDRADAAFWRR